MTPETLSTSAAVLLSLLFSYLPGLAEWYAAQDAVRKRLVMLAALLATCLATLALACSGWGAVFAVPLACTQDGAALLARCFALALAANQAAFLITPRPTPAP